MVIFTTKCKVVRDWSLITAGKGGYKTGGGGACEVLPLRKGGKTFSHAEGGGGEGGGYAVA